MKYWVLLTTSSRQEAIISCIPADGPKINKYNKAKPLADVFPTQEDAIVCFDPNFPENVHLTDAIDCLANVIIVNSKVKEIFISLGSKSEFLPVIIWDHQDKPVSEDYFIFNCLDLVDFIDMEKSELSMDILFTDRVNWIKNLVVKQEIEEPKNIFCPFNMKNQIFVSDEAKNALESADIEGFKFLAADTWDGLTV